MLRILKKSISNGILTTTYPAKPHVPPQGFRGKPEVDFAKGSLKEYRESARVCPTHAITFENASNKWRLDYGLCIFCGRCEEVCSGITLSGEFELAARKKSDLFIEATFQEGAVS